MMVYTTKLETEQTELSAAECISTADVSGAPSIAPLFSNIRHVLRVSGIFSHLSVLVQFVLNIIDTIEAMPVIDMAERNCNYFKLIENYLPLLIDLENY